MLGHFEHQVVAAIRCLECIQNRRQMCLELHVDDGADDLRDFPTALGVAISSSLQN